MKVTSIVDEKLIERSLEGDERAFESLVQRYHGKIISLINQIIGNKQEAEDIAQEVFIKVFYKLKDFNPKYPFYAWLYRIAINRCYDFLRAKKRARMKSFSELSAKEIKTVNTLYELKNGWEISTYDREDINEIINKLIMSLKPKERAVIFMRDVENLEYKEIAQILKCSELAARIKVSRARKTLRTKLEQYLKTEN
jgi:RNA polymerase sigma-70 factor (ECF subfamily)